MRGVRVVLSTAPRGAVARRIARVLVEERLAACVNRLPVSSTYRWRGKVCTEPEDLLVIKTSASRVRRLLKRLRAIHPYDCPEGIVLDVSVGLPAYMKWVVSG